MSRVRDRLTERTTLSRCGENRVFVVLVVNTTKCVTLRESVKNLLHVIVLLELVDELEDFGGLRFG